MKNMKHLKTFEQFDYSDLEKVDEGLFSTSKYDILKKYKGKKFDTTLANDLKNAGIFKEDISKVLTAIGVDNNSIKTIDKAHVGEKKLRFLTADESKINELLSKIDTISKDEINKTVLYTTKTTFKDLPKEKWIDAANKIVELNKKDSKKYYYFSGRVNNGEIEIVGAAPYNQFAGGGGGTVGTAK